jgi:general secretion pathway protein I
MNAERGFTLVETLIAFAILAVVLVSLYEAIGTGFRSFAAAARVDEAVLIAQSQMDRLVALKRMPDQVQGNVDGTPYQWRIEVVPPRAPETQTAAASPLRAVSFRLAVSWPAAVGTRNVAIERLVFLPRQPGG